MNDRLRDVASGRTAPRKGWFEGRANRNEYWLWAAPNLVIGLALAAVVSPLFAYVQSVIFTCIWIRRLHDLGRTGWWVAAINVAVNLVTLGGQLSGAALVTGLGALLYVGAVAVMGIVPGQPRENEYGPPSGRRAATLAETFE